MYIFGLITAYKLTIYSYFDRNPFKRFLLMLLLCEDQKSIERSNRVGNQNAMHTYMPKQHKLFIGRRRQRSSPNNAIYANKAYMYCTLLYRVLLIVIFIVCHTDHGFHFDSLTKSFNAVATSRCTCGAAFFHSSGLVIQDIIPRG